MKTVILVIDPALVCPSIEAIQCISKIIDQLNNNSKTENTLFHMKYFSPYLAKKRICHFVDNKKISAIISLGSYANVTDNSIFLQEFTQDLSSLIFTHDIPFMGICFSHQVIASIFGMKVDYLKNRINIPGSKHYTFRSLQITHPKFAFLSTNMHDKDYHTNNALDLNFKEIAKMTKNWGVQEWFLLQNAEDWKLSTLEYRVKNFIQKNTLKNLTCHARHEQEIWDWVSDDIKKQSLLFVGAKSNQCQYEALVHAEKAIYTLQTHPETPHEDKNGYLLLKNFIYLSALN